MNISKLLENPNCCINCMRSGMTLQETPFYGGWSSYYTPTQSSFNCRSHHSPMRTLWRRSLQPLQSPTKKMGILKHLVLQNIFPLFHVKNDPVLGQTLDQTAKATATFTKRLSLAFAFALATAPAFFREIQTSEITCESLKDSKYHSILVLEMADT